jgi:hypothetical protein
MTQKQLEFKLNIVVQYSRKYLHSLSSSSRSRKKLDFGDWGGYCGLATAITYYTAQANGFNTTHLFVKQASDVWTKTKHHFLVVQTSAKTLYIVDLTMSQFFVEDKRSGRNIKWPLKEYKKKLRPVMDKGYFKVTSRNKNYYHLYRRLLTWDPKPTENFNDEMKTLLDHKTDDEPDWTLEEIQEF